MKLHDDDYEFIKKEVIDLFERYNICCIPISGFELAVKMGIILIPYSSLSKEKYEAVTITSSDGVYFEPGDGREIIYYNDAIGYERCNMTILHEIAHSVLGHYDGMDPQVVEAEAKFFAKYAAAPPPLVHKIKPNCSEDIASVFMISNQASQIAYEYYCKWLKKYEINGRYLAYESKLLMIFDN